MFFLVGYATRLLRSLAALPHSLKLASITFKNLWVSTCSKSSIVFTDTKSDNERKNDANIRHLLFSHNAPNLSRKILHKHYF